MAPTLFFSYSHADEALRNELEKHLSALKRQGKISAWHDRRIVAGEHVGNTIDANLEKSEVILLLISPDFIASDYCYEREMKRALEKQSEGSAQVIAVILRPCDWHELPFGNALATPRDGKAITTWTNLDEAFLDVVKSIKGALKKVTESVPTLRADADAEIRSRATIAERAAIQGVSTSDAIRGPRSSNLRVRKQFTEFDKDRFRQESFDFIANYFANSMRELVDRNPDAGLAERFQRVDAHRFTAAVYQNGEKVCKGSASVSDGLMGRDAIQYQTDDNPRSNVMNEAVYVKADDQTMYLEPLGMSTYSQQKEKLTQQGAAEFLWNLFIRTLQ